MITTRYRGPFQVKPANSVLTFYRTPIRNTVFVTAGFRQILAPINGFNEIIYASLRTIHKKDFKTCINKEK